MKLNICMLVFLHYQPNMRLYANIEQSSYLHHFGHNVTWIMWGEERRHVEKFSFEGIHATGVISYTSFFSITEDTPEQFLELIVNRTPASNPGYRPESRTNLVCRCA